MSCDGHILSTIAIKTGSPARFFEIVNISWGAERKKCVLSVGKHSISFLRLDLDQPIHAVGELKYGNIKKVIRDQASSQNFLLALADPTGWNTDRVLVRCTDRDVLLKHLRCSWQTDAMWRLSSVVPFPLSVFPLTKPSKIDPPCEPFMGHSWVSYQGYKFMLPDSFTEEANSVQSSNTGQYADSKSGVSVQVRVHDIMTMDQLCTARREELRWVAGDYKTHLLKEETRFYVLGNCQRPKRSNLVRDAAAWTSWELIIRTPESTVICILFRRQCVPPLCDSAQDIAFIFRIPAPLWASSEVHLRLQARLVADSTSPVATAPLYRELVQAKLDGLRFDEDGVEWLAMHHKLHSQMRHDSKIFARSLIKIFVDNPISLLPKELLDSSRFLVHAKPNEEWSEIAPLPDGELLPFVIGIGERARDTIGLSADAPDALANTRVKNRWLARVARYFSWAVDGGLLGPNLTLEMLIERIPEVEDDTALKKILMFMLHMREPDMAIEWRDSTLLDKLQNGGANRYKFNDRVMQCIISADYLRKQFGRTKEALYFSCLSQVLMSSAGTKLKEYICRLFMEMRAVCGSGNRNDDETNVVAVPSLLHLLQEGGVFLAMQASAALVNLSVANEAVKTQLINQGLAQLAVQNIRNKDDDLTRYTLMLMVNLTKETHRRNIMASAGALPLLYDLLTSSYTQCQHAELGTGASSSMLTHNPTKERILELVCSLIGHFCKDELHRDHLVVAFPHTVKCLCYICTHVKGGTPLMSKVMFALKQICATRMEEKRYVGATVIKSLLTGALSDQDILRSCHAEFIDYALLLLQLLSTFKDNCVKMEEVEGRTILQGLASAPAARSVENLPDRVKKLQDTIRDVMEREFEMQG